MAILGVVAVHCVQKFPTTIRPLDTALYSGSWAVQLFYFVSALTMCHMWEQRENEPFRTRRFYLRRFFRIAPLFWLAIPFYYFVGGSEVTSWQPCGVHARNILLTAGFLNWADPVSIHSVVPGGTTITIEMTFYLFFPFLMLRLGRHPKTTVATALLLHLATAALILPLLARYLPWWQIDLKNLLADAHFWSFLSQAPIFLLGIAIHSMLRNGRVPVLFLCIAYTVFLGAEFAGRACGLWHSDLTFMAVVTLLGAFSWLCMHFRLSFRPLEWIGQRTYEIYIFHFFALFCLVALASQAGISPRGPLSFAAGYAAALIMSLLFVFLWRSLAEPLVARVRTFAVRRFAS